MTARSAMQSAAVRLIGRRPAAFFGTTDTFEIEMCDLINEVAQDVFKYRDWQALVTFATLTGDGSATVFDMPADYDRQLLESDMQDTSSWAWGYGRILDVNEFKNLEIFGTVPMPGVWALYGNKFHFTPAPSGNATFPYVSNLIVNSAMGTKAEFTDDQDTFVLPERLLTLGLVWRWRENKKLDASGDQEAFVKALDEYAAKDGGSRVQRYGGRSLSRSLNVGIAWPGGWG